MRAVLKDPTSESKTILTERRNTNIPLNDQFQKFSEFVRDHAVDKGLMIVSIKEK